MKKKITIIFCIIILMFNFILTTSYAETSEEVSLDDFQLEGVDATNVFKYLQEGGASIISDGEERDVTITEHTETTKSASAIITSVLTFGVEWINNIPQILVESTQEDEIESGYFTIYSLVMGEYEIFNIDFSDIDSSIDHEDDDLSLAQKIKYKILFYFNIFRNLSIALSLLILIYIGIRMTISTLSKDIAKYKKMLIGWLASLMLLLFMHFIIVIMSYTSNIALNFVKNLAENFGITNVEEGILSGVLTQMGTSTGFHLVTSFITVAIFVYYQIKFCIAYLHRFCEIALLTVVSPLVTVTYSIDKVADNKAQAFQTWFKELSVKYYIQVLHAITYCIFIASAGVIATQVPLVGAFFLLALDKVETVFRKVLDVKDDNFQKAKVPFIGGKNK